jgi:hypothetical protein
MKKILNSKVGAGVVVALIGAGFVYYSARKAGQVVGDVGQAFNPVNQDNMFYGGVNAVGAKITGGSWSLGSWLYNVTHDDV